VTYQNVNEYLKTIPLVEQKKTDNYPIFIVGAPRSGTTLISQAIISSFDVEYPTNFIAKFWGNPIVGYVLQKEMFDKKRKSFISSFGSTHGYSENSILEPHEFGYFWNRWFNHSSNHYTGIDTIVDNDLIKIINNLLSLSKKNWVFKNLTLGLKIPIIKKLFPTAKFIYIKRNPYDVSVSIYNARINRLKRDDIWWSVIPKEVNNIKKLIPKEQVVAQVYYINNQIENDINKLSKKDYMTISYENFIDNYDTSLDKIGDFMCQQKKTIAILNTKTNYENNDDEITYFVQKYFKEVK